MLKPPDKLESDRGVAPAAAGVLLALALAFALALSAANIVLGPLNLDEGWYLLAARNFAAGLRPYRDFFFTQAPLMPAAYGALSPLWLPQGVLGGRVLTATLGLAASGLAACAAAVAAGQGRRFAAAVTAFLLLQCNVVHSYFTAIPKTYALAALFASGGALALALAMCRRKAAGTSSLLAGLLFALASATRLSLGAMLPAIGFCLLATHRRNGLLWFWFGIGGAAGLAIAIAPFALCDLDSFAFANFFHGGRSQGGVALALGSVSRLLRNYMPLALLALAAVSMAFSGMRRGAAAECGARAYLIALSLAFASAFAVHVLAPFPYDDYQTPIMPLAAIVASAAFWSLCGEARQAPLLAAFLLSSAAFALTSPMNESWLVLRKDRFWVEKKTRPDLLALRDAARDVALISPTGAPILTQDGYLAVEAGLDVPAGFEMGPFGFFAELSDGEARRYHVLNLNLALDAIRGGECPVAALSGYAFSMSAPALRRDDGIRAVIDAALRDRYALEKTIPDFGQEHTPLAVWRLKEARTEGQ